MWTELKVHVYYFTISVSILLYTCRSSTVVILALDERNGQLIGMLGNTLLNHGVDLETDIYIGGEARRIIEP